MIRALAITGPTASGKTAISIALAREIGCEIISCDSMQIYKDMNIGTAKVTKEEAAGIPHHLIDLVEPSEPFSVEDYRALAIEKAKDITERGGLPLLVGGTGLYVDALMRAPMTDVPESRREYRDSILEGLKTEADIDALWQRLREVALKIIPVMRNAVVEDCFSIFCDYICILFIFKNDRVIQGKWQK